MVKWVSDSGWVIIITGDGGCRLWQPVQTDSQPKSSGLVLGRRLLGALLHLSNEPDELSQWLWYDDSTVNIVLDIIILLSWVGGCLAPFYIYQMNRMNSHNGSDMMTAPWTLSWILLYYYHINHEWLILFCYTVSYAEVMNMLQGRKLLQVIYVNVLSVWLYFHVNIMVCMFGVPTDMESQIIEEIRESQRIWYLVKVASMTILIMMMN